ncbi:Gfo/Idh/MocA family oxidoreductase [Novosphingobium sp. NBM11]|uniref:Gfo/Idh/MocA family protein n=1 Tax=Novosphingobium sp. NBM11 TaxID=2596914 RepID=UPI0018923F49|nr:Gfo/Idh/MocA family oxidoreductase [Novosphingobium sp. NBM11]MBF5091535.1 Gfo/Idh/MocA family oxidoreductase [Novosphingobium sp. NBM11]
MNIAFVGCGYVFDIYMRTRWAYPEIGIAGVFDVDTARSEVVRKHYGLNVYPDLEALLTDPTVDIVVNLTNIASHDEVTRKALEAGKHVYTEKPITTDLDGTRALFALAEARGRVLAAAPCNLHSDAVSTIWKAVTDGAIGKPVLIYAEMDDNPAHLMRLDTVQSPTGAPFPYAEELQEGCTIEHVGYHLAWMCAMFGPVVGVTAFSKWLVPDKVATPLSPPDTPDFSVACLDFENGVAARVTCSWVAPRDHRMRIIGDEGELSVDNAFHDQSPVRLERFSRVSLTARKAFSMRNQPLLGQRFGVGGTALKLVRRWKSHAVEAEKGVGRSLKHRAVSWLRRREIYAQDKLLGIAEMGKAIAENRSQPMPADFLIHLNELTLLIHRAGTTGITTRPTTTFAPLRLFDDIASAPIDYRTTYRPKVLERFAAKLVDRLHRR